jgi:ActR/RegA family two-component response regulator
MKQGAFDYITKPINLDEVVVVASVPSTTASWCVSIVIFRMRSPNVLAQRP